MPDVVFVTPNMGHNISSEPSGTLILASILVDHGVTVQIMPMADFGDINADTPAFFRTAVEKISASGAKIVSFYTRCDTYHLTIRMSQMLKQDNPARYIVYGGQQSDLCAEDSLRSFDCIDFICRGEGETTIFPFFRSLLNGQPDLSVPGLAYCADGQIISNPRPPMLRDFSDQPMLDYRKFYNADDLTSLKKVSIDVGRGCPFNCTYCSTKSFWNRYYRLKEPDQILREICFFHENYGVSEFAFEHDMFTMNRKKVMQICQSIRALPFPVRWSCSARLDCLDEELIDEMYEAGMRRVFIGIETGSPRMQRLIRKNLKLEKAEPLVRYLSSKNINTAVSFIYGFPDETEEDLSQTMELWLRLSAYPKTSPQLHLLTFLPGTELEQRYHDQLTPATSFSNITGEYALDACADIIRNNPRVFPQYCEYETPLRAEALIAPAFLRTYARLRPVYEYIRTHYYSSHFAMYLDWAAHVRAHPDFVQDPALRLATIYSYGFLDRFAADPLAARMSEINRHAYDRTQYTLADTVNQVQMYLFRLDDLQANLPLEAFRPGATMVQYTKAPGGRLEERIRLSQLG